MLDEATRNFHQVMLAAIPPAPRTPSAEAVRLNLSTQPGEGVVALVGLIFLVVCGPLALAFTYSLPVDLALSGFGRPVPARVLQVEMDCSFQVNDVCARSVDFEFDLDGRTRKGSGYRYDDAVVAGSLVNIEAIQGRPEWHRMEGETYTSLGYMGAFTWLFPLVGSAMLFTQWQSRRHRRRAFLLGAPVIAKVTAAGIDRTTKVNGVRPWRIEWSYTWEGKSYTGKCASLEKGALEPLLQSEWVPVLVDPDYPNASALYVG